MAAELTKPYPDAFLDRDLEYEPPDRKIAFRIFSLKCVTRVWGGTADG